MRDSSDNVSLNTAAPKDSKKDIKSSLKESTDKSQSKDERSSENGSPNSALERSSGETSTSGRDLLGCSEPTKPW